MRRRDVMDPEVERELAALDAALAGSPEAPPELAELARAVRAERPDVSPGFADELDAWAAAGFPAGATRWSSRRGVRLGALTTLARRLRPRRPSRRALLPALGAATSLVVAVAVAASLISEDGGSGTSAPLGVPEGASPRGAEPVPGPSSASTVPPPAGGDRLAPGRARRVERQASLVLAAPGDRVAEVSDGVVRATDEVEGIVVSSSVSDGDDGQAGASFRLRIPVARLDDALARLSRLAHVRSRTQATQDVTGSFVTARERLDEALAERRSLLRRLERADSDDEAARLRERLRVVRARIDAARASLRRLRVRTEYSAVSVAVQADGEAGSGGSGAWTPGDALDDAVRVLEVSAGVALVSLAVIAPLALLGIAVGAGARVARRRRREQALSAG